MTQAQKNRPEAVAGTGLGAVTRAKRAPASGHSSSWARGDALIYKWAKAHRTPSAPLTKRADSTQLLGFRSYRETNSILHLRDGNDHRAASYKARRDVTACSLHEDKGSSARLGADGGRQNWSRVDSEQAATDAVGRQPDPVQDKAHVCDPSRNQTSHKRSRTRHRVLF